MSLKTDSGEIGSLPDEQPYGFVIQSKLSPHTQRINSYDFWLALWGPFTATRENEDCDTFKSLSVAPALQLYGQEYAAPVPYESLHCCDSDTNCTIANQLCMADAAIVIFVVVNVSL